jgi:monofunctional glycosyltransferase
VTHSAIGRFTRFLGLAIAVLAVCWFLLVLFHAVRPASSTLMQARNVLGDPVDRRWVALDAISRHLPRAVIAAEDQRFCLHGGVDWGALGEVLGEEGGPSRGASTITMQTVKNLYLWPGRSYLRKALEIPMALVAGLVWSKARVMELYLNVAEWGDGVFGAEAASQRYFGKSARDLTAVEAARLAAALPNPRLSDPRQGSSASRRVAQRMTQLGKLADCVE